MVRQVIGRWVQKYFSDPQAISLLFILVISFGIILLFGELIAPLLAAVVIAYLLEWAVSRLEALRIPRKLGVVLVFLFFLSLVILLFAGLVPMFLRQLTDLVNQELPTMLLHFKDQLMSLPERYPDFFTPAQVNELFEQLKGKVGEYGELFVSVSLGSLVSIATLLVYLILVPLLVFFCLKDRDQLVGWVVSMLPEENVLVGQVWHEMNAQIGNYVRGKVLEIIIVAGVTYAVFTFFGLNYALLLSLTVGFSVLIPYIGAAVVTIPVAIIAWFQWGWAAEFGYIMIAYAIIQALDGNLLVPVLFSEAVNLHPVAIIVAVLVFGGIWGFWGVFFAIPLATLVKAVVNAWPRRTENEPAPWLDHNLEDGLE